MAEKEASAKIGEEIFGDDSSSCVLIANTAVQNDEEDATLVANTTSENVGGACALIANDGALVTASEINGHDNSMLPDKRTVSGKPECVGCVQKDIEAKFWETKYKDLKRVYLNQSHHFSELTIKHNVLLTMKPTETNDTDCNDDNTTSTSKNDIFSPYELKILQNMSLDKKKDSTFIHQCLEYAYKNDLCVLSNKTLKGKSESVKFTEDGKELHIPKKYPLSPEKVDRIKQLFVERISKCKIDSASFEARMKDSNINKLFASSIKNIANKIV